MSVIPLLKGNPKIIEKAEKSELVKLYDHYRSMSNEWLRRQVIDNNRIDILAIAILGYKVKPFHLKMLQYQFLHPHNLQLAFRGAGKSTLCTVTKCIHLLLKDPNLRILLASKKQGNAGGFLKEIKSHFEGNERLIEIFGEYYDPHKVPKWNESEIEVLPRTKIAKEASITCVGLETAVASKHYDVIIADDLIDEKNSRTKHMRHQIRTWFYQTLDPCLEPPSSDVSHRGEFHILGTRYHYDDLYGHLIDNELKEHYQNFPALDKNGRTPWPEKYTSEWANKKRKTYGTIIFNAQYQCDVDAMKGTIFQYDDCQPIKRDDVPKDIKLFGGIDLAIGEKETNDRYANILVGVDKNRNYYVLYAYTRQLRFRQQVKKSLEVYYEYDPILNGVESNAYQLALYQEIKDTDKDARFKPVNQDKDKITRAWKLSSLFEEKKMFFVEEMDGYNELIDQLVLFPDHEFKDLFDALDIAIGISKLKKRRKKRTAEPGLI